MARSIGVDRQIKVMGSPLVEIKRAIAVKKGNTLLLARLDKAVSQFLNSGRYQEIYVKWHGEPAPSFWDNRKIIYLLGALFFLISSSLVLWRYRTLIGLNQKLEEQIGERKQVEERLIENEKNLEIIMDSMYVGIILIDPQNHRIVDINKYGLGMIGLPEDEVINKLCHDFICPAARGNCPITDLGQQIDSAERVFLNKNGEPTPILKTVIRININDRELLLESFIDISQQKEVEKKLQKSRDELENRVKKRTEDLFKANKELQIALDELSILSGMLPICANCKKIRDDSGYWNHLESYIQSHSEAKFSHGICPDCANSLYPEIYKKIKQQE